MTRRFLVLGLLGLVGVLGVVSGGSAATPVAASRGGAVEEPGTVTLNSGGSAVAYSAASCTKTWNVGADGQWGNGSNWTPTGVPGSSDTACIPAGTPAATFSGTTTVASLQNSGTLTVTPGSSFSLTAVSSNASGGTLTVQGLDQCGGSFPSTLNAGGAFTNAGTIVMQHVGGCGGGVVSLNAPSGLTNTGTLHISGAGGPDPHTFTGTLTNQGTLTIDSSNTLSIPSGSSLSDSSGTIDVQGTLPVAGSYVQGDGAVTTNPVSLRDGSSASFTGTGAASLVVAPSEAVGISGTLAAAQTLTVQGLDTGGGSQPSTLNAGGAFTNAGTIVMQHVGTGSTGVVSLNAPSGLTNTGTLHITGSGGTGPHTFTGTLINQGTLTIDSSNTLSIPAGSSLSDSSGTIDVQGTLPVAGSYVQGNGAVTTNPVSLRDGSSASFTGTGAASLLVAPSEAVGISGTLAAAQTLTVQGLDQCGGSFPSTLNASGAFTNAGTIVMQHVGGCGGGVVSLNAPSGLTNTGTLHITGAGGPDPHTFTGTLTNQGTLTIDANQTFTTSLHQTAGSTTIGSGSTLDVSGSGGPLSLAGGTLNGTGTVTGSVNNSGGAVAPGMSPGVLTLSGNYIQGRGGKLGIAVTGTAAEQYSTLAVAGNTTLHGALVLHPSPGYAGSAAIGDRVAFLTYGGNRVGSFASISVNPSLAGGKTYAAVYQNASKLVNAVVGHKPAVITLPKLSGVAKVGNSLSVTTGTWKYSPTSYAYRWLRCTSLGYSCKKIVGATSSSYLLTAADVGHKLKAKVAASNAAGSATATTSNTSAKVKK